MVRSRFELAVFRVIRGKYSSKLSCNRARYLPYKSIYIVLIPSPSLMQTFSKPFSVEIEKKWILPEPTHTRLPCSIPIDKQLGV